MCSFIVCLVVEGEIDVILALFFDSSCKKSDNGAGCFHPTSQPVRLVFAFMIFSVRFHFFRSIIFLGYCNRHKVACTLNPMK